MCHIAPVKITTGMQQGSKSLLIASQTGGKPGRQNFAFSVHLKIVLSVGKAKICPSLARVVIAL